MIKPYPFYDYRVYKNRDKWHYCNKPWTEQCKDFHNQAKGNWETISVYSKPELRKEIEKREEWYSRQHERNSS